MAKVTVPVVKPLTYQGRQYVRGERVTCEAVQAAAFAQGGYVSLARGVVMRRDLAAVDDVPAPAPPTRRRYRRRDLTAEGTGT
jgi:hypothetical protein